MRVGCPFHGVFSCVCVCVCKCVSVQRHTYLTLIGASESPISLLLSPIRSCESSVHPVRVLYVVIGYTPMPKTPSVLRPQHLQLPEGAKYTHVVVAPAMTCDTHTHTHTHLHTCVCLLAGRQGIRDSRCLTGLLAVVCVCVCVCVCHTPAPQCPLSCQGLGLEPYPSRLPGHPL